MFEKQRLSPSTAGGMGLSVRAESGGALKRNRPEKRALDMETMRRGVQASLQQVLQEAEEVAFRLCT